MLPRGELMEVVFMPLVAITGAAIAEPNLHESMSMQIKARTNLH